MCNTTPLPDRPHHQQTPLWPTTVVLGRAPPLRTTSRRRSGQPLPHSAGPRPSTTSSHPDPRNRTPPCPRRTARSGTFCAEGNRLRTKRPRFVTFYTKRYLVHKMSLCTQNVPTRHSHPHDQEPRPPTDRTHPRNLRPTPKTPHTTSHPHHKHHPHEQVPFSRQTSTVLTSDKYRSHGEGAGLTGPGFGRTRLASSPCGRHRRAARPGRRPAARPPGPPTQSSRTARSARRSPDCCGYRSSGGTCVRAPPAPGRSRWAPGARSPAGRRRAEGGRGCRPAPPGRPRPAGARRAHGRRRQVRRRAAARVRRGAGHQDAGHTQRLQDGGLHPGLQGRGRGLLEPLTQDLNTEVGVDAPGAGGGQDGRGVKGDARGVGHEVRNGGPGQPWASRVVQGEQAAVDGDQGRPDHQRLGDGGQGVDGVHVPGAGNDLSVLGDDQGRREAEG